MGTRDTLIESVPQSFRSGSWRYENEMWYRLQDANFTFIDDFTVGGRFKASTFPIDLIMGCRVPVSPSRVYGYISLQYGNYQNSQPNVPLTPRRVSEIAALQVTLTHQIVGNTQGLNECWLTATPHPSNLTPDDRTDEIGFFTHVQSGTVSFMNGATQFGTWVDPGGTSWTIARYATPGNVNGAGEAIPYTMLRPTSGSHYDGFLYWKEMLLKLVSLGILDGTEYFNGMAIGHEPLGGQCAMKVSAVSVNYS